jgi:flavin reductase (DIM6/NTAB) family NADH-FMN oxidoreductase RutF
MLKTKFHFVFRLSMSNSAWQGLKMETHQLASSRDFFIQAMRHVACSVTVVTTDGPAGRHGATVSAFSSVSADPPTVLICLRTESRIGKQVLANGRFTVNVLAEENHHLARVFTGEFDVESPDRFAGQKLIELDGLSPGLEGATVFACELAKVVVEGSHSIFFGRVAHASTAQRAPLTYLDGSYRTLHLRAR